MHNQLIVDSLNRRAAFEDALAIDARDSNQKEKAEYHAGRAARYTAAAAEQAHTVTIEYMPNTGLLHPTARLILKAIVAVSTITVLGLIVLIVLAQTGH